MPTPEEQAREKIDQLLEAAGWQVQDRNQLNLSAGHGVAVREFPLTTGFADYLLFADRKAVGRQNGAPANARVGARSPRPMDRETGRGNLAPTELRKGIIAEDAIQPERTSPPVDPAARL